MSCKKAVCICLIILVFVSSPTKAQCEASPVPVGFWMLDNTTLARDLTGNGNDAPVTDVSLTTSGPFNSSSSIVFSVDSTVSIPNNGILAVQSFTFFMYVKRTRINNDNSVQSLLTYVNNVHSTVVLALGPTDVDLLVTLTEDPNTSFKRMITNAFINLDEWTQVIGTYDYNSGWIRAYKNGVEQDSLFAGSFHYTSNHPIFFGHVPYSIYNFGGSAYCLQIYDTALNVSQFDAATRRCQIRDISVEIPCPTTEKQTTEPDNTSVSLTTIPTSDMQTTEPDNTSVSLTTIPTTDTQTTEPDNTSVRLTTIPTTDMQTTEPDNTSVRLTTIPTTGTQTNLSHGSDSTTMHITTHPTTEKLTTLSDETNNITVPAIERLTTLNEKLTTSLNEMRAIPTSNGEGIPNTDRQMTLPDELDMQQTTTSKETKSSSEKPLSTRKEMMQDNPSSPEKQDATNYTGAYIGGAVGFVALIAVVATVSFRSFRKARRAQATNAIASSVTCVGSLSSNVSRIDDHNSEKNASRSDNSTDSNS